MSSGYGYPDSADLKRIEEWSYEDLWGWFDLIEDVWCDYGRITRLGGCYIYMATGGWSGNEDIIGSMKANTMCWMISWESQHRGGAYVFSLPRNRNEK